MIFPFIEEYEEKIKSKQQPEVNLCPKCDAKPGMFKLHEKRVRQLLVLLRWVHKTETVLLRWKCPLCDKSWTEYPWFIEPNKRYVKQTLILKALKYVSDDNSTYRSLTSQNNMPMWYEEDIEKMENAKSISHTTLYR